MSMKKKKELKKGTTIKLDDGTEGYLDIKVTELAYMLNDKDFLFINVKQVDGQEVYLNKNKVAWFSEVEYE